MMFVNKSLTTMSEIVDQSIANELEFEKSSEASQSNFHLST